MKNRINLAELLFVACTLTAAGQSGLKLPCDYSGNMLRKPTGDIIRFNSEEMKARATRKVDISDFMKRVDLKGTAIIDVLVGPSGDVVCAKTLLGHPIFSGEVEKAVHAWTFKPEKVNGEAVAYVGRMQFYLCNISCGDQGISMSIVK